MTRSKKILIFGGILLMGSILSPGQETPTTPDVPSQQVTETEQIPEVKAAITESVKSEPIIETRIETKTEPISYESRTEYDSSIEKGTSVTSTNGAAGETTITYELRFEDGIEVERKEISRAVTKSPTIEVVVIGTKEAVQYFAAPAPQATSSSCDPNYGGGCVPNVSHDLDCPDIGFSVTVIGTDPHKFDGNNDGYGCEAYN